MVRLILGWETVLLLDDSAPEFDAERQDVLVHPGCVEVRECHVANLIHLLFQLLIVVTHKVYHQHQCLLRDICVFTFAEVYDIRHNEVTFFINLEGFFKEILCIEDSFESDNDNFGISIVQWACKNRY